MTHEFLALGPEKSERRRVGFAADPLVIEDHDRVQGAIENRLELASGRVQGAFGFAVRATDSQQEADVQSDRCTEGEEHQREQHQSRVAAERSRHERCNTQGHDSESDHDQTGSDPATVAAVSAKEREHGHGTAAWRGRPALGGVTVSGSYASISSPFREDATPGR